MTFTFKDFNSWKNKKICNSNRVHSILCAENFVILFSPVVISGDLIKYINGFHVIIEVREL